MPESNGSIKHFDNIYTVKLELVSKGLNHFGVIECLFWQIGGYSSRFVLFCSFWRLFTIKIIKSVKIFPFSFWKIIHFFFFFYFIKFRPPAKTCKMATKWLNSLDTNSSRLAFLIPWHAYLVTMRQNNTQRPRIRDAAGFSYPGSLAVHRG